MPCDEDAESWTLSQSPPTTTTTAQLLAFRDEGTGSTLLRHHPGTFRLVFCRHSCMYTGKRKTSQSISFGISLLSNSLGLGANDEAASSTAGESTSTPHSGPETKLRQDLSVAHKATQLFGMDELLWNHISARVPASEGDEPAWLASPGRQLFDEIGPVDLVRSSTTQTPESIHGAINKSRPDVNAVVELRCAAAVAVSCLDGGFVPIAQRSFIFHRRVGYVSYSGASASTEQAAVGAACSGIVKVLVMRNSGFCTLGATVAEAWVMAYYFTQACETQMALLQTGQKISHVAPEAWLPECAPGMSEWDAIVRLCARAKR